ncbi:unnamed protein product, partial [Didymodactylos carnosus]
QIIPDLCEKIQATFEIRADRDKHPLCVQAQGAAHH